MMEVAFHARRICTGSLIQGVSDEAACGLPFRFGRLIALLDAVKHAALAIRHEKKLMRR